MFDFFNNRDKLKGKGRRDRGDRIILSDKDFSEGHKKRIEFVNKIISLPISEYIDVYGHGFKPIPDKWDAIAPYKYHLVLENSVQKDYWSEKLADSFLGFSFLGIFFSLSNENFLIMVLDKTTSVRSRCTYSIE